MKRLVLYLDESGIANLIDVSQRYFLITGLIIDEIEDRALSGYFSFLKRRHFFKDDKSLHAYDLFEGSERLNESKSKKLTLSLSEFINITPFKVIVVSVEKSSLKSYLNIKSNDEFEGDEKKRRDRELPYEILSSYIFLWFSNYAKKQNARCAIVAESRMGADHTLLRTYVRCQQKDTFKDKNLVRSCGNMRRNISSIRFESKSGVRSGLELADIISYVSFLKLNKRLAKREFTKRGLSIIWHEIEKKMEKNKIQTFTKSRFSKFINPNRVRKTSK